MEWDKTILELGPNLFWILRKFSNPFQISLVKIETRSIKGGARWVPKKTHPITIPNLYAIEDEKFNIQFGLLMTSIKHTQGIAFFYHLLTAWWT